MLKNVRPMALVAAFSLAAGSLAAGCTATPKAASEGASAGPSPVASVEVKPVAAALTVTDVRGTKLTLPRKPERIVCLTGLCDDALVELGLTPVGTTKPALLTRPEYLGERGKSVPVVPGSFGKEDVEAIARAKPDLVIGLAGVQEPLKAAVEKFAPLWLLGPKTYEDSIRYLRDVAALTDRGPQQAEAERRFRDKLAAAQRTAKEKGLADKTALAMYGGWATGVNTRDDLLGQLLAQVFRYPWPSKGGTPETASAYSVEEILAGNPQLIFVQSFTAGKSVTQQFAANPVWKRIPAVRDGKVYEVSPDLWASGRGTRSLGLVLDEAIAKSTS